MEAIYNQWEELNSSGKESVLIQSNHFLKERYSSGQEKPFQRERVLADIIPSQVPQAGLLILGPIPELQERFEIILFQELSENTLRLYDEGRQVANLEEAQNLKIEIVPGQGKRYYLKAYFEEIQQYPLWEAEQIEDLLLLLDHLIRLAQARKEAGYPRIKFPELLADAWLESKQQPFHSEANFNSALEKFNSEALLSAKLTELSNFMS